MVETYNTEFYDQINGGSIRSARIVLTELFNGLGYIPQSVVDIGCGEGAWLSVCKEFGIDKIRGIDGDYIDTERLLIDSSEFLKCDLAAGPPITFENKVDLCISLEVAEHLPESIADLFVASLVSHSDLILFSAAVPGQRGVNHINEQWPSYWTKKFWKHGYGGTDALRWIVWDNPYVENWYKQNIIVFKKGMEPDNIKDVVHPNNSHIAPPQ